MMARLRSDRLYYWGEKAVKTFASGYITTGNPSKFDFGPLTSTFSVNTVEGFRLRVGGMTTAALSPRWFARGYVARGFKDHKWKYSGEVEYSFRDKRQHSREFPFIPCGPHSSMTWICSGKTSCQTIRTICLCRPNVWMTYR